MRLPSQVQFTAVESAPSFCASRFSWLVVSRVRGYQGFFLADGREKVDSNEVHGSTHPKESTHVAGISRVRNRNLFPGVIAKVLAG